MQSKFDRVPDKWILGYAFVTVEETLKLDKTNPQESRQFAREFIRESQKAYQHWQQPLSVKAIAKLAYWWLRSYGVWLSNLEGLKP